MLQLFSTQSVMAGVAAAVLGTCAGFLMPIVPPAAARVGITVTIDGVLAKGDRLPSLVTVVACSAQSWPSFDQKCLFDLRRPADEIRRVRVVSLIKQ
jgi:hypothetical protein